MRSGSLLRAGRQASVGIQPCNSNGLTMALDEPVLFKGEDFPCTNP